MGTHSTLGDFSARSFLALCLAENDRRLSRYDPRLLRPALVAPLVRTALKLLPGEGAPGDQPRAA